MRLYNTLTGRVDPLEPAATPVRVYVCGVTPYDTTHLGHAFLYTMMDVLVRNIERHGRPVRYVQNVTDIDDPLFQRARDTDEPWQSIVDRQMNQFLLDQAEMNMRPVDVRPYVSQEVEHMIPVIQTLEERGFTYTIGDRLFFRTKLVPDYGSLGGLSLEARYARSKDTGNDPNMPGKESPLDFLLWRPSENDEPSWPSPWGPGRPGWHIECSEMAIRHLGDTIDIHGGGEDLIFPHHASEIAQSEAATGKSPFSRYWLHVGMVRLNGVKMSKSLGNLVFTRELLERYSGDAIRLYLLNRYYRDSWDHSEQELADAAVLANRVRDAVAGIGASERALALAQRGLDALDDDLNTAEAYRVLESLADLGAEAAAAIRALGTVLGLRLSEGD